MKLTLAAAAILAFSSPQAFATTDNQVFDSKGLKKLELKNSSGDSKIATSTDGKAYVSAEKVEFGSSCAITMNKEGGVLVVKVEKEGLFSTGTCKVNFAVKIPESLALDLRTGSGAIAVQGTKGDIDFRTGSGNTDLNITTAKLIGRSGSGSVKASGSIGDADLKSGSGDIALSGLRGDAKVNTGSGDISLIYSTAPQKGQVELRSGSGNAVVSLPAKAKVLTQFRSGSGQLLNELGDTQGAPFVVSAKSGSGNLKIKTAAAR